MGLKGTHLRRERGLGVSSAPDRRPAGPALLFLSRSFCLVGRPRERGQFLWKEVIICCNRAPRLSVTTPTRLLTRPS